MSCVLTNANRANSCPLSHLSPPSPSIEQYNIKGVEKFAKEMDKKGLGKPKVSLQFELNPSGITQLIKAEAAVEETVMVEEEEEVDDNDDDKTEEENATASDDDAKKDDEKKSDDKEETKSNETKEEASKKGEASSNETESDDSKVNDTTAEKEPPKKKKKTIMVQKVSRLLRFGSNAELRLSSVADVHLLSTLT